MRRTAADHKRLWNGSLCECTWFSILSLRYAKPWSCNEPRSWPDWFRTALERKKQGESHNHRPSPRFDLVDFDLRREIGLTALRFFSGVRLTRRDP
jgi:hypothetical protein